MFQLATESYTHLEQENSYSVYRDFLVWRLFTYYFEMDFPQIIIQFWANFIIIERGFFKWILLIDKEPLQMNLIIYSPKLVFSI